MNDGTDVVTSGLSINVSDVYISTPGRLPNATQGTFYTTSVTASGGTGPDHILRERPPERAEHDVGRRDCGTPNAIPIGKYQVNITAFASVSGAYNKTMSLDVIGTPPALPALTISGNTSLPDCTFGVVCSQTIMVAYGGTAPFTWTASGLPPGMGIRFGEGVTLSRIHRATRSCVASRPGWALQRDRSP